MKKKKTKVLIAMLVMIVSILEFYQTVQAAKQKIFYKYNIMTGYEVEQISLNKTNVTIKVGQSIVLKATGTSDKVSWMSSNAKIVDVRNGKVTGLKAGTAVITAKINDSKATCNIKVKEVKYIPSQFEDYGKVNKLIHCFDIPIGFYANPALNLGRRPSGVDTKFMIACSAWHVDEKYWKEIPGVEGYGEYSVDKKYVEQECKKLFGKNCSVTALTESFILVRREGPKVSLPGWSSPCEVTSKITDITQISDISYQVNVIYTAKSVYSGVIKKQTKTVFTVKKMQTAPYGYYVSEFKFS